MQFIGKCAFVAMVLACSAAFAQRGAASKAAGNYNFYSNSAGTSVNHAIDYAVGYQQYLQNTPVVNQTVAADQINAITDSVARAKRHFAELRKNTTNPETLAKLDLIEQHLNEAAQAHNKMIENNGDQTQEECLNQIVESLRKAMTEHQHMTGGNMPASTK